MIWYMFLFIEIVSIAIYGVMYMCDGFKSIIPDYGVKKDRYDEFGQKVVMLFLMAFVGGWMFAPYFCYLVYKCVTQNKR